MSVVSYAQDFHGSFARNATREMLRRLFADVTQGVYVRIAPVRPTQSAAVEWLCEAGWLSSPPGEIPEGGVQLLLVELGCHDPTDGTRTAGVVTGGRPWVVMAEADGRPTPSLEQQLGMAGYAFAWFDETYRYLPRVRARGPVGASVRGTNATRDYDAAVCLQRRAHCHDAAVSRLRYRSQGGRCGVCGRGGRRRPRSDHAQRHSRHRRRVRWPMVELA